MSAANDRSPIGVSLALSGAANDEFRLSIGSLAEAMPMTYGVSAEQRRNGGGIDAAQPFARPCPPDRVRQRRAKDRYYARVVRTAPPTIRCR